MCGITSFLFGSCFQNYEDALLAALSSHNTNDLVVSLMESLLPIITTNSRHLSPLGCSSRAREALRLLHTEEKKIENIDTLMVCMKQWTI